MGAFDQARNVRQYEFAVVDRDDAELRMQRGEGVIRDLRLGGAHARQKRRLAGVGQAHKAGIRDQLEAQPDGALLAGKARIGTTRRAVGGRFEMGIAEAAIAALGEHGAVADPGEIGEERFVVFVENLGALRYLEHDAGAGRAGAVLAHAVAAGLGLEMLLVAVIDQGVEAIDTFGGHVAPPTAVAPIRAAELDELLAPERDATRSAVAGADVDLGLVEKLHRHSIAIEHTRRLRSNLQPPTIQHRNDEGFGQYWEGSPLPLWGRGSAGGG